MVKLQKYWFYKYPYKVSLLVKQLPSDIVGKNFSINDIYINFITNKKGLRLLDSKNIYYEVENDSLNNIKSFLSRRLIGIISILIIMFLMFFSNHYIRTIEFENDLYYNEEVYKYLQNNLKRVGNIYLAKKSINDLSINLRNEFNYYAFIGLIKDAGVLKIKIIPNNPINKHIEKENDGLYASKNAYICYININKGKNLITYNQMVKAGQLLVEGKNSDGVIIGRTIEIETLSIKKNQVDKIYTGNYYVERYFEIFKYNNNHNTCKYENYYLQSKIKLNFYFLKIYELTYYEIKEEISEVNIDLIKNEIFKIYEEKFYKIKRTLKEVVLDVKVLSIDEDEEYYYLKLLTSKNENIIRE